MSQHQCTLDFGQRVISITDGEGIHHDVTESTYQTRSMQGVAERQENVPRRSRVEEKTLSSEGRIALAKLLKENARRKRAKSGTSGLTTNSNLPRCRLRLRDDKDEPVAGRYYKMDAQKIEFLQKLLTKWEKNKLIEPSSSRYGARAMLVAKKEEG